MTLSARVARRSIAAAVAATTLLVVAPVALADPPPPPPPPPGCSAADFEQVKSSVAAATSAYFFTHPDVNAFFSTLHGQPKDQVRKEVATYFQGNPQAQSDLGGIRQPLHDFKARCG
jgi:heme-binding protein